MGIWTITSYYSKSAEDPNPLILEAIFVILSMIILLYIVRHLIFTLTVLHQRETQKEICVSDHCCYYPSVTILIPARNEERVIGRILRRMTELTYPKDKLQVIVIDDGSEDKTGAIAERFAEQYDFIGVIHRNPQEGGQGKASALNVGLKHAKGEIILCFDADYYSQINIVEKLVAPFCDPKVVVVQGRVLVINESENVLTRLIALERVGGYRVGQQAREELGLIPLFGGTAGGFRRRIIEELEGFDENMLAEDTDLTFRIFLAGYKLQYVNCAESYEEAVHNLHSYWHQRLRWAIGHMQCAFRHLVPTIKCKNLSLKQKIDAILSLNVYFLPVLTLIAWIIGGLLLFRNSPLLNGNLVGLLPFFMYSSVGNFAPFFEIGLGMYLDGRTRACRLLPLLFPLFLYNIIICTFALVKLCVYRILGKRIGWRKTIHYGSEKL